jgi:GTP 3',8-cyclase
MSVVDAWQRPLTTLRISVTDRCNLRCRYCMPETEYAWLPDHALLSFDELTRLAQEFVQLGVETIRLTGGEPTLRPELPDLVARLAQLKNLKRLAMTTNGTRLGDVASDLKSAGLQELTVSLDTLSPATFFLLSKRKEHAAVLEGIASANKIGLLRKLDCVVMRHVNDSELVPMLHFARELRVEVRFIEYMDVGGATQWSPETVVSRAEMLRTIEAHCGPVRPLPHRGSAPAERFQLVSGQTFGIVASTTRPFCGACDRTRLTSDGMLFNCLYSAHGLNLREPLRAKEDVSALIRHAWNNRSDRGAEARLQLNDKRAALFSSDQLKLDVHREMHTRGG